MKPDKKPTYEILKTKSKDSLAIFYMRYGRKLLHYAQNTWKIDEDDATELVYQCLYKITDSFKKYEFQSEEKFSSFVFTVFINNLRNYYRKQKNRKEHLQIVSYEDIETETSFKKEEIPDDTGEDYHPSENIKLLQNELDKLQDWERMLLLLRAQEMPYSEIVNFIDKPENQLKVYFQRLKLKIAENIKAHSTLNKIYHE